MFDWTDEQREIIEQDLPPGHVSLIQGFAGCSKTTTLFELCKKHWEKRILYVAFNRSLMEASREKFRDYPHVQVETFHSFALKELQRTMETEPIEIIEALTVYDVMDALRTEDYEHAAASLRVLEKFYSTVDSEIDCNFHAQHLSRTTSPMLATKMAKKVHEATHRGLFPYTHDAYLKRYADTKPHLLYDVILVDEAQDITPLQLQLVRNQTHASLVLVGDEHQTLYAFRFVCNPFQVIPSITSEYRRFTLSRSFRFGSDISRMSTAFLRWFKCDSTLQIQSHETQESTLIRSPMRASDDLIPGSAFIFRSNRGLVKGLFDLVDHPKVERVFILGGTFVPKEELRAIEEIQAVLEQRIEDISNPFLAKCTTLGELRTFFGSIRDFKSASRVDLFSEMGKDALTEKWERVNEKWSEHGKDATVIVGTVHQSKGLEFDTVCLGDDFPNLKKLSTLSNERKESMNEMLNITYVAMTRAKKQLYLNASLFAFFDQRQSRNQTITKYFSPKQSCKE